jgi:hypothetical protein
MGAPLFTGTAAAEAGEPRPRCEAAGTTAAIAIFENVDLAANTCLAYDYAGVLIFGEGCAVAEEKCGHLFVSVDLIFEVYQTVPRKSTAYFIFLWW